MAKKINQPVVNVQLIINNQIIMGDDEFILYVRKRNKKCQKTTKQIGRAIADWMILQGFYNSQLRNKKRCKWETKKGAKNIDKDILPKTANQFLFDRTYLPKLYDFLDTL